MAHRDHFDGTAARQLTLTDEEDQPITGRPASRGHARPPLRMMIKDVYRELDLRRRRAQIAARHRLDETDDRHTG